MILSHCAVCWIQIINHHIVACRSSLATTASRREETSVTVQMLQQTADDSLVPSTAKSLYQCKWVPGKTITYNVSSRTWNSRTHSLSLLSHRLPILTHDALASPAVPHWHTCLLHFQLFNFSKSLQNRLGIRVMSVKTVDWGRVLTVLLLQA